jgi:hypothetical protein
MIYAMRALPAAGSEIRPYRTPPRIAQSSILPIFHSSRLQESILRDNLSFPAVAGRKPAPFHGADGANALQFAVWSLEFGVLNSVFCILFSEAR